MQFPQPAGHCLAQINVSTARWPMDDPRMAGFNEAIDVVNAVAERSPGFIWRLTGDGDDALDVRVANNPDLLINMSLWADPEALEAFVWKTVHAKVYNQKAQWFPHQTTPTLALWWQKLGTLPSADDGMARLQLLRDMGPGDQAFGWAGLRDIRLWQTKAC